MRFSCAAVGGRSHSWPKSSAQRRRAPILKRYVRQVRITAPFFDARRTDHVESFVAEADRHPVFRLIPPA